MSQNGMSTPIPRSQIILPPSISQRHPLRSTAQHADGKSDVQKDQKMDRDLQVPHHAASPQNFQSRVRLRSHCLLQT